MAKQLNVNLAMTADTSKAKAELQSLQKQLDSLMIKTSGKDNFGLSSELQKSVSLASQLKTQLASAIMSNGNLDLSKFNLELQKSGLKIQDYKKALTSMGPAGTQAFQQLASSIMSAEVPLRRSNALLTNFATTLKNTARWQISSSILHGFMGALQGAYGYAQDLNESLNNIRIVTGQSVDEMARFAEQANRAAKELSTSTTAYADAALIYYQQGLTGKAVTERADTTIKLANVSRQSAEEVSSQLTAIWNNFADGSENLEYYADVITALGAATASSSDEIAQGLQKFASIADTVGLSYEKATAALATVVAETRQSADVVGTAFKTMFARFQGLSLGETLEDGVDLNKYSKALATVGVNILDANGHLKDMDAILDDTAEKWNQISEAQRVALAETVAGTRQYAQFMAIMNNYDKIQANQTLAANSSGTLQEQADIYAESWEAAQKRVKAAAQGIYQDLLDDKFFIGLLNGFEKALTGVDNFIEGIGGIKTVLLLLGTLITQVFGKQISASIQNAIDNVRMLHSASEKAMSLRKQAINSALAVSESTATSSTGGQSQAATEAIRSQAILQETLLDNANKLTDSEKTRAQALIDITKILGEQVIKQGEIADAATKAADAEQRKVQKIAFSASNVNGNSASSQYNNVKTELSGLRNEYTNITKAQEVFIRSLSNIENLKDTKEDINDLKKRLEELKNAAGDGEFGQRLAQRIDGLNSALDQGKIGIDRYKEVIAILGSDIEVSTPSVKHLEQALKDAGIEEGKIPGIITEVTRAFSKEAEEAAVLADGINNLEDVTENFGNEIDKLGEKAKGDAATGFTQLSSAIMGVVSAITAIKNIGNIWSNEDLSMGEKLLQTFSSLAMIIPAVTAVTQKNIAANVKEAGAKSLNAAITAGKTILEATEIPILMKLAAAENAVLAPLLTLVVIGAVVIGIIYGIAKAFQSIIANSPEGQLNAAKDKAKELKTALDDATTAANNLKSAFDSYESAKEKLDKCTKGTQEWRDALEEVNNQALQLIRDFPGLKFTTDASTGEIIIDPNSLIEARQQANNRVIAAQGAYFSGQQDVRDKDIANKINNLTTQGQDFLEKQFMSTILNNNDIGKMSESELRQVAQNLAGNAAYAGRQEDVDSWIDAIIDLQSEIKSNTEATKAENQVIASAVTSGNKTITDSKYASDINKISGELYSQAYNTSYQNAKTWKLDEREELFNRYKKLANLDDNNIRDLSSDQNGVHYKDSNGQKQTVGVEEIAKLVAAADAAEQLGQSCEFVIKTFEELDASGQEYKKSLRIAIADGDLTGLNQGQFDELEGKIKAVGAASFLDQELGNGDGIFTDEEAQKFGRTSAEAFIEEVEQGLELDWDSITKDGHLPQIIRDSFKDFSFAEAKGVQDNYLKLSGSQTGNFKNILDQIPKDKLSDVLKAFGQIDFSNWDSIEGFKDKIKELGIAIDNVALDNWIADIQRSNEALHQIDIAADSKTYKASWDAVNGLSTGDSIDADKYAALGELGQAYFSLMEDGTYQLIGNAEQLRDAVQGSRQEELLNNISSKQNNLAILSTSENAQDNTEKIQAEINGLNQLQQQYLNMADTVSELDRLQSQLGETLGQDLINTSAYSEALIGLASQYDNCEAEVAAYQAAMVNGTEEQKKAAEETLKLSTYVGEMAKQSGLSGEDIERYAEELGMLAENADVSKKALAEMAKDQLRFDNAVISAQKNIDKWTKDLEVAAESGILVSETAEEMATAYGNLLDIDGSELSAKFLQNADNLKLMQEALNGDEEAYRALQDAVRADIEARFGIDDEEFQTKYANLFAQIDDIRNNGDIEVGANLDDQGFLDALSEMVTAAGMTAQQAQDYLSSMGLDAEVVNEPQKTTETVGYDMVPIITSRSGKWEGPGGGGEYSYPVVDYDAKEVTVEKVTNASALRVESASKSSGGSIKHSHSTPVHNGSNSGAKKKSGGGGGSKGKAETSTAEKHIDEEHRYHKISKEIEGLTKQFDRLNKAKERAFGANKIRIMEQEIVKLKQLQKSYEQYLKEVAGADYLKIHKAIQSGQNLGSLVKNGAVGGNLAKDYKALLGGTFEILSKDAAGNDKVIQKQFEGISHYLNGISVQLDEFGNIANKDDISEAIEKWWNTAYVDWWNALNGASQKLQSNLDKKATLEAIKEYLEKHIDRYQETVEKAQDVSDKLQDTMYQIQDQIYENFRYKIDLKVEIDERSLKRIEYAIKVLGDNIYKVPEVMQAWFDKRVGDTMGTAQHLGETWKNAFYEAQSLHASGQISDEQYIQTIKDAQDGLYGCVDQLLSMNEEMREYYGNVLTHVQEEMARITDEMDHQLNTLTHLQNVLSLLGRETDFEAIGAILEGQRQMNLNSYNVAKAQVEMYKDQVAQAEQNLEALRAGGASEDALNEFKNAVLYPAQEALRAAEEEMQADFEAYLETLNAIYDNKINQIYQDSERRLAGAWGSFDEVANALSRQRALDDEYLTKTNQIYETNTLLRKLQQDMDKTDNAASKLRLKNFSDEILAMQQKERLNKTDLDIAKARYELLQAQIALEDAQNAKSTVRLQRDNEGNYGYVYTADQEQVDNAEQNVADKENDLYNLVLGQANDYTEKILQTTRERNEALKKLDEDFKNGLIKDEETYNQLKQDIITKYNDLLESEYYSYYTAIGWLDEVAATDHTEAWTSSFQDILAAGENFQGETDLLMQQTGETVDWLNQVRAEATEEAKVGTEDLKEQVGELTKANNELATKMTGEVVPAMNNVLTTAQKLTATWAAQYDQIMALINEYLSLIDVMQNAMNSMANGDDLTYDPEFDYSRAMADYLSNGGSKSDLQYTTWQKQREMKIDDMGLSQDFYGSRGEEFEKNIDTYVNNNLTGYIQEAVDKFNEANGGNTEALESNTQANTDNTEAVNNSTTASGTNTEALGANSEALGTNGSVLGENTSTLESSTGTLVDSVSELENSHQESVSAIQDTVQEGSNQIGSASDTVMSAAEVVSNAAGRVAASMAAAASSISSAAGAISSMGSVMSGGSAGRNTLMPMATGGYTGSWGTSGKLAILHEKELVLNKEDTANLLDVVSMVRDFSSAIDLRAGISSAASGLSSPGYAGSEQSLQQDVTIHAEFPNATNHSEIEEAFNTLINRASQYAGRLS